MKLSELFESGDIDETDPVISPRTQFKRRPKPNMKKVEDQLKAHALRKIEHEKKYGDMSPADRVSHDQIHKQLLKKLSKERSKANNS